MAEDESDPTRLSDDQVIDRFCAAVACAPQLTVASFFEENRDIDQSRYLVATIVSDVRRRQENGNTISPREYFQQFDELTSNADAWRILDATEAWLIANEGPDWADRWAETYPIAAGRFARASSVNQASPGASNGPELDDLKPGDRVLDFQVERFIGKGTFGRVYLANDLTLDRQCALKVTVDQGSEGRVLARLNHPGIVHVYREQSLRGKKLLAMQFVDGQSLASWVRDTHAQPDPAVGASGDNHVAKGVRLIRDVANSLKHAHVRGVLHRDIKPANILIDSSGQPMLSDFNVATSSDRDGCFTVGGTINYMSPEQLKAVCLNDAAAEQNVDIRSDVYSLGVVLLETITGQKVWSSHVKSDHESTANQLLASRIRSGPPSIVGYPGVTPALSSIVQKALQPNPDDRYQSASEFETDLTNWIENRNNVFANNPSFVERARKMIHHQRNRWIGGTVITIFLLALSLFIAVTDRRCLQRCVEIAEMTKFHVSERRLTRASELLGQAKTQCQQLTFAKWFGDERYVALMKSLTESSRQISLLESQRFSTLFGEISLREVHQQRSADLANLIEDGLRAYGVTRDPDWQQNPPFADLDPIQKKVVAEGITELMLVSMQQSAAKAKPTESQVQQVLGRLPREHRSFKLFDTIESTQQVASKPYNLTLTNQPFEAYLYGVLASIHSDHQSASHFYAQSLRASASERERFWCHYRYAYSCQKIKRHDEALIHYGVCLGLQPDFAWPKFNMALACLDKGNSELAANYIEQAIEADRKFTAAYVTLMAIQTQQENYNAAIKTYDQAIANGLRSSELTKNYSIARRKAAFQTGQNN